MNPHDTTKSDRALELSEKGLKTNQIAERLGSSRGSVSAMIIAAKRRRAKAAEVVES